MLNSVCVSSGLIADAVGEVTHNEKAAVEEAIKNGTLDKMILKIQDQMMDWCKSADSAEGVETIYTAETKAAIQEKLEWLVNHEYTAPTDEQISDMVHKLVHRITNRFNGGQICNITK